MNVKDTILKIAFKLFIEIRFGKVSIQEIIKEASITKNDFYFYFNSKEQLICEGIEKFFFRRFDDISGGSNGTCCFSREKLLKIFRKYSETECYLKK